MAPRSGRASAPAKSIRKKAEDNPAKQRANAASKPRAKPAPASSPRPKDVPKHWLKDPDKEWYIQSEGDKRRKKPHRYTVRRSARPSPLAASLSHMLASSSGMLTSLPVCSLASPCQVAYRTKDWSCTCPDFMYRQRRQHSDCKHIAEVKKSRRPPDAVHSYALSDETIAQLKEYQKDKSAERRAKRGAKEGAPVKKDEVEPVLDETPPPGLPKGCHERHERAVLNANRRLFEKMTVEEMKHQLRAQDQLITGTRRELVRRLIFHPSSCPFSTADCAQAYLFSFPTRASSRLAHPPATSSLTSLG
jgi:hypothetical protein